MRSFLSSSSITVRSILSSSSSPSLFLLRSSFSSSFSLNSSLQRSFFSSSSSPLLFSSPSPSSASSPSSPPSAFEFRLRSIAFRAGQRGILELDLVIGTWVKNNLLSLSKEEIDELEEILNEEAPDMLKIITQRGDIPDKLSQNKILKKIIQYAQQEGKAWSPNKGNQ